MSYNHDSDALLKHLLPTLQSQLPGLIAVYRFGSFGTPAQRPDSDIDLGLHAQAPLDPVRLFHVAAALADQIHRDIDLVDMIRCSTVMRAQIVASGNVILCTDPYQCEDFATTAFSRYAHLNEARRGIFDDIQQRGSIHGR